MAAPSMMMLTPACSAAASISAISSGVKVTPEATASSTASSMEGVAAFSAVHLFMARLMAAMNFPLSPVGVRGFPFELRSASSASPSSISTRPRGRVSSTPTRKVSRSAISALSTPGHTAGLSLVEEVEVVVLMEEFFFWVAIWQTLPALSGFKAGIN